MSLECPPFLLFLVLALFYHFSGKGKEIIIYTSGWSFHATTQFQNKCSCVIVSEVVPSCLNFDYEYTSSAVSTQPVIRNTARKTLKLCIFNGDYKYHNGERKNRHFTIIYGAFFVPKFPIYFILMSDIIYSSTILSVQRYHNI